MVDEMNNEKSADAVNESIYEGRDQYEIDIDRMVNEGLGGGNVTMHNGLIDATTTDTMDTLLEHERNEGVK